MRKRINTQDEARIGVYRIIAPSEKMYVGMTCDSFESRWNGHKTDFRLQRSKCKGLLRAANKYGVENLVFEIVEEWIKPKDFTEFGKLEKHILLREKHWWNYYKDQGNEIYNGEPTGTGSVRHTEETRENISQANIRNESWKRFPNSQNGEHRENVEISCEFCMKIFTTNDKNPSGFCSRSCSNKNRYRIENYISYEELYTLYVIQQLTPIQVAEQTNLTKGKIWAALAGYGIPIRGLSSAGKISFTKDKRQCPKCRSFFRSNYLTKHLENCSGLKKCLDCGKQIRKRSIRCLDCFKNFRSKNFK